MSIKKVSAPSHLQTSADPKNKQNKNNWHSFASMNKSKQKNVDRKNSPHLRIYERALNKKLSTEKSQCTFSSTKEC